MSLSIIAATGVKRDVSEIIVRDENNTPRTISEVWIRDENNVPRQVWGGAAGGGNSTAFAATANPDLVTGAVSRKTAGPVGTNYTTVTATGGKAPYTFSWGAKSDWTVASPNSATTAFTSTVSPNQDRSETFTCTVTDALGATVTADVEAMVSNYYSGGGDLA